MGKDKQTDIIQKNKERFQKRAVKKIENLSDEQIKKIKKGYESNYPYKKIARESGIEYYKIRDIIEALIVLGFIDEEKRNEVSEEKQELKRTEIKKRYEAGEDKVTIIKEGHIQYLDYEKTLEEMKQQGLIDEEKRIEVLLQKQEPIKIGIKKLYEAGLSKNKISQQMHMSYNTLKKIIKSMLEEGLLDDEKRQRSIEEKLPKEKHTTNCELEERVKKAYENNSFRVSIAKQEHVPYSIIKDMIDKMIEDGTLKPRRNIEDDKKLRIKQKYEAGLSKTEIMKQEHIGYETLENIINEFKEDKDLDETNREKAVVLLNDIKVQLKDGRQISIKPIENHVNAYINVREFDVAIIFLECVKNCRYVPNKKGKESKCLSEEQTNKIVDIQEAIKRRIKQTKAVEMLKENKPIGEIAKSSNLPENEVYLLDGKIKEMNNKIEHENEIA